MTGQPVRSGSPPEADDPPSAPSPLKGLVADRRAWFPAGVLALFLFLVAGGFHGSSVGQVSAVPDASPGLVLGEPRPIRSDEWYVRTPFVVAQAANGFPDELGAGVGPHDATVLYDLPTSDWSMVFRPHLWGYVFLPLEQGFAFDWWGLSALVLIGVYALLLVGGSSVGWAIAGSLLCFGSPFLHWWYIAATFASIGYGCASVAALLALSRADSGRLRRGLVVLASWLTTCFALQMYPPFQIPILLVLGGWVIGREWSNPRWRGWSTARLRLLDLGIVGLVTVLVLGVFVVTKADAIAAISGTAYPGSRRVPGGDGLAGHLGSAWIGWNYLTEGDRLRGLVFGNESEASSFLLIGLFCLAALPLLWPRLRSNSVLTGSLIGVGAGAGLLAGHMFVSLPFPLARVTLLDRVPPGRAVIGLGVASMIVLVTLGQALTGRSLQNWRRLAAGVVVGVLTCGYVAALVADLRAVGAPVGYKEVAVPLLVAGTSAMLLFWRPLVAAGLVAAFGLFVSLPVNPLVRGLAPLTGPALASAVELADQSRPGDQERWLASGDGLGPILTATGIDLLSGVNLYPDEDSWRVLDPSGSAEEAWNRYAHTIWTMTPGLPAPRITLVQADVVSVEIDPCGPELDELDVGHLVTTAEIDSTCFAVESRSSLPNGQQVLVYERSRRPASR